MDLSPYLNFDGDCAEAFAFYAKVLEGEITLQQTFGESPMAEQFPDIADKMMHISLRIGDHVIMGSDTGPSPYQKPAGISVTLGFEDFDRCQQVFEALAEGGDVTMPFAATFWSPGFGLVTDRFGIPWMVDCTAEVAEAG